MSADGRYYSKVVEELCLCVELNSLSDWESRTRAPGDGCAGLLQEACCPAGRGWAKGDTP